ncbi:DUF11 domain-containing protein [Lignipirellula cremea]|uniref:Large cysteine-rich periplasmic protein OmcB n=1 Tax=Lignipirellula cremea TaxID=2528010 RepID=A0A518E075_9BACT|nr:DUF11 domain-containing protein [Lignipirellula cremea]QDU97488.1 Large cysteine-rich periplasmic protein OmcB precursor [Lignipirellula cremea]
MRAFITASVCAFGLWASSLPAQEFEMPPSPQTTESADPNAAVAETTTAVPATDTAIEAKPLPVAVAPAQTDAPVVQPIETTAPRAIPPTPETIPFEQQAQPLPANVETAPAATEQQAPAPIVSKAPAVTVQQAPAVTVQQAPAVTVQQAPAVTVQQAPAAMAAPPANAQRLPASPQLRVQSGVAASLPIVSAETVGPPNMLVGTPAMFRVKVTNLGDDVARDVALEVLLPVGAKDVKTAPQCVEIGPGRLRFALGALDVKATRTLSIHLTPGARGAAQLETRVVYSSASALGMNVQQPQLKIEATGAADGVYSQQLEFKVVVTNTGDAPCRNIRVRQIVPAGLESLTGANDAIPQLNAGERRELTFAALPKGVGEASVRFEATADGDLRVSTVKTINITRPMIEVSTEGPSVNYLQREGVYAIVVANTGDGPAVNVQVISSIPAGLKVLAIDRPAKFDQAKQQLTWTLASIPVGGQEVMRFKAVTTAEGQLVHEVQVQTASGMRAKTRHLTDVISRADVNMQIADSPGPIQVGEAAIFEVQVRNRGTSEARNVELRAELPSGMGAVRSSDYETHASEVRFPVTSIAPGGKQIFRFEAVSSVPGDQIVKFKLSADSLSREVTSEESVYFYKTGRERVATRPLEKAAE